ncbi:MAG: substrate-binding domain-containing protein, partial [Pseudomonadota bacterium]
ELLRSGVRVPEDISVISIHDLPASEFTYPPLTTVHLPARRMGRQAAESLAAWVEHDVRPEAVQLGSSLIVRGSTRQRI